MTTYTLVNPSDPYIFDAESDAVAAAAGLLLGMGMYAVKVDGRTICPIFLSVDPQPWFAKTYGVDLSAFLDSNMKGVKAALCSVRIEGGAERTSMNDISKRAKALADALMVSA